MRDEEEDVEMEERRRNNKPYQSKSAISESSFHV